MEVILYKDGIGGPSSGLTFTRAELLMQERPDLANARVVVIVPTPLPLEDFVSSGGFTVVANDGTTIELSADSLDGAKAGVAAVCKEKARIVSEHTNLIANAIRQLANTAN